VGPEEIQADEPIRRLLEPHRDSMSLAGARPEHVDDETLGRHASGDLPADSALEVAKHLASCEADCRDRLRAHAASVNAAREALYPVGTPHTPGPDVAPVSAVSPRGEPTHEEAAGSRRTAAPLPTGKSIRSFACRDVLWEMFEQMARELECSVDYLVNESMNQYARQRSYAARTPVPGQVGRSQTPIPGSVGTSHAPASAGTHTPMPGEVARAPYAGAIPPGSVPAPPPSARAAITSRPSGPPPLPPPSRPSVPPPMPPLSVRPTAIPPAGAPQASPTYGQPAYGHGAPYPGSASQSPMPAPGMMPDMQMRGMPPPMQQGYGGPPPPPPPAMAPMQMQMQMQRPMAAVPYAGPMPGPAGGVALPPLSAYYAGQRHVVTKDRFIIGRGKNTTDMTVRDPNISRQHAMIEYSDGQFWMVDLGSTNGVEFGGQRITRKSIVEGDLFVICGHEIRFSYR